MREVPTLNHCYYLARQIVGALASVLFAFGGAQANDRAQIHQARGFDVKDSGYRGSPFSAPDVYWLDKQRIAFIGQKGEEYRVENGQRLAPSDLFVWDIRSGMVRKHADLSAFGFLCVRRHFVRFGFTREGIRYVGMGDWGREHLVEEDTQALRDGILAMSPISCREYNPKLLQKRYGKNPLPLLSKGEYLDRTLGQYVEPLRYFPEDGSKPVPLSEIPNREVNTTPRYSEYLDRYVFHAVNFRWGEKFVQRMWLVNRRGAVTVATIPAGPWMEGSPSAMPTARGWLLASTALKTAAGMNAAGMYLVRDQRVVRILPGVPHWYAISPDGCKAAVAIDTDLKRVTHVRIMMIDICSKGD